MTGHTFYKAIIYVKFNRFQAFLRKGQEKVLFMMSQCFQLRNNPLVLFWHTRHIFYFPIILLYNKDEAFMKAHFQHRKFSGLSMYRYIILPCSFKIFEDPVCLEKGIVLIFCFVLDTLVMSAFHLQCSNTLSNIYLVNRRVHTVCPFLKNVYSCQHERILFSKIFMNQNFS
jgi:hypothetical protein